MSLYDELRAAGAPAQPAQSGTLYDDLMRRQQEQQQLRASLTATANTTPQRAAELNYLSQVTGMPRPVVENAEEEAKARAQFQQMWELSENSPVLRAKLANPKFTELAKDDVGVLTQIERAVQATTRYVMGADGRGGLPGDIKAGYHRSSSASAGAFRAVAETLAVPFDFLEPFTTIGGNPLRRLAEGFGAIAEQQGAIADNSSSRVFGVSSGVQSLVQNAKYLPLIAFGPVGGAAALTGMVSESFGASYQRARQEGISEMGSLIYGASDAAIEYATEKLPMSKLLGDIAANTNVIKMLGKQIAYEVPGEQIATVLQDMNAWAVLNPEKPFKDYLAERPSAAAETLIATVIGTGGNVALAKGMDKVLDGYMQRQLAALDVQEQAQQYARLLQVAGQSQLRERDPEQFRAALNEMAEKAGAESVYIDAQVLNQMAPDVLAQLPGAMEQLPDALATNATVELKIADVLTVAPGTGLEQLLVENIRTSPEALSPADVKQAQDQLEVLNQDAQRVVQQAADAQAAEQARETVKQTIAAQLTEAGRFSPEVNNAYASLVSNFFTVLGSRRGMTAQQAYAEHPLRVVAGRGAQQFQLDEQSNAVLSSLDNDANVATLEKNAGKLRKLYKAAGKAKPTFDALMTRVARQVDGGTMLAPLKGTARATAKIKSDYNGDPTKIKDLVRGTIEIRTAAQAQAAVRQVLANFRVLPTGQRNLLDPSADPIDGYRDAKFNVDLGNGVIGEVQINLPQMLAAKSQVHGLYEERSAIERKIQDEKRQPTPGEQARIEALNAGMKAVYDAAWAEATSDMNSSLDNGDPLRRADSGSNGLGGMTSQAEQYAGAPGTGPSETGTPSTSKNSGISGTSDTILAESEVLEQAARVVTGSPLFEDIITAMGLTPAEVNSTAMEYMTGLPGDMAFLPPSVGGLKDVVAFLHERRLESGLPRLDISKPEDRTQLARLVAAEALAAIRNAGDSLEWYDTTVAKTLAMMAVKHPELESDPYARNAFLVATAIASQGLNVEDNLAFASQQYEAFRATGRFPLEGKGESSGAMVANFQKANDLIAELTPEGFRRFLVTPFTVRELEYAGFPIGGETMDTTVLGSSILGPKIGFGFYSNLNGNFEPVTMDMWFMRTIGRLAGTLPAFDPAKFAKQVKRLRDSLDVQGDNGIFADQFDPALVEAARTDEGMAIELARQVKKAHERDFKNNRADYDAKTRVKSDLVRAGETMLISLEKPKDVPASGGERNLLRDVVGQVVDIVAQQYGERVPPAALQALIWYPEQELYKAMGVGLRVTSQDYAGAARKLLESEGFDGQQLDSAAERGAAGARRADGAADTGAVPGDDQGPRRARPLEASERTRFIVERNRLAIAQQRGLSPANVVFEVAPDPNDAELTDAWRELTSADRLEISQRVAGQLLPNVLRTLAADGQMTTQVGSYLEDTNPSFALRLTQGNPVELAQALGFILAQDSMVVVGKEPFAGSSQTGAVVIEVGEKTPAQIDEIYQALRRITINGEQPVGGQSTVDGEMVVLNFSNTPTQELAAAIDEALAGSYTVKTRDVHSAFPEKKDYDYASSERDDRRGSDAPLRRWARDARAEAQQLLRAELQRAGNGGELYQSAVGARAQRADASDGADGRSPHSWSGTGIHFSKQQRTRLDGRYFGTGLKGIEQTRLAESTDSRIKERVYFYIDEGQGIRPEAGVGGFAHEVKLDNLYNVQGDPLKLFNAGDLNASESRVLDAGYSGYYFPAAANRQGIAIVMGEASRGMQAKVVQAPQQQAPQQQAPQVYRRGLLSRELNALDIEAVRAVAPSANVRAGNFTVNADELEAARGVLAGQGINLPEQVLNQDMAQDMDAQVQFLTERAQAAGFPDVDTWLANDAMGFMRAAEEWRQMNPAEELTQPARGTYNPAKLLMTLNDNADLSTFLHETGHFFLEVMADVASQPGAPADVANDMAAVLKWFGVKDLATWNGMTLDQKRRHHERFAEGFEQYLLEGKAPSRELQGLFRKFRNFMVRVYRSLQDFMQGRELNMTDEVRRVFDRMLATDEQIAEAEQYAGMQAQFDATDEAIEQLQARSLRDLKWAVNARAKFIKQLQAQARDLRKAMEARVRAEVEEMPVYKAMRTLREGPKLAIAGLEDLYMGEGDRYALLDWKPLVDRKMAGAEGIHPDIAADMFGFPNGDALVRAILDAEPMESVIEGMTDQRMLEEHGDLIDQRAIEEAATEAVHNEARARALATELTAQAQMSNPRADTGRVDARGRPITVNAMLEAAKQFAAQLAGRKRISDLKRAAYAHLQAERRAAKAWEAATAKGDTQGAVKAKQDQLLNHEAYRALLEAQRKVDKANAFFAKVFKGNNEKLVERGYDPDIVAASRAILSAYGLAPRLGKNALEYMDLVAKNDPELAAVLRPSVEAALVNAKPYDQLTVDELDALQAEIESMQTLAKRSRQMEVDGNLLDIQEAADELKSRMEKIGVPLEMPGQRSALTPSQERTRWVQFARAVTRRMEQWSEAMGPEFTRLVFGPVKDAANRFRADRNKYRKQYQQLLDKVAPALRKGKIDAPELGYTFGQGHNGIGHAELLHAILHTGNESNKRKLLLGRGWATENEDGTLDTSRWDTFVERMQAEGYLAKAHYDFAQGVWDMLEGMKPLAQRAHRDVFGRYFAEVTANAFETPFGTYRGGYVPAQADPRIVTDAALRKLSEMENENMAYSFPAANRGFTKSRVDYNRPLILDLRSIGQHIDKVLLFSHMQPAVNDVNRLLRNKGVSQPLSKIDPAAYEGAIIPWLNRSVRQQVETPIVGDGSISRALSVFRNRAGMGLMFANLSNTVQQITGFSLAATKVRPGLLLKATTQYLASPKKTTQFVAESSPFMKDRMDNEIAAINDAIDDILLDPSVYKRAQTWTQKHAYFLQAAVDNVMSPIVWMGAYNQALEAGGSEADAIKAGDAAVRQTQGSTLPEDVSRIESGPAAARLFTQFLSYFNMMANTNGAELTKISREMGLRKGAGKALFVVTAGLLLPLWIAEAIAIAFRGGPEDEDEDGWYLDDWIAQVIGMGTIKGSLAMVPFAGAFANVVIANFNDNPLDDRINTSPAISLLEGAARSPVSVYKAIVEDGNARTAVRDLASAITMFTGLPAVAVARPLGYLAGVADDRVEPTGPADFARGLVTGAVSPESRQ